MKSIRKWAALLLALCLLLGLTACAADEEDIAAAGAVLNEVLAAAEEAAAEKNATGDELTLAEEEPADTPDEPPAEETVESPEEAELMAEAAEEAETPAEEKVPALDPDGSYTTKEDVALYLHLYGELPKNFITKSEARGLGWSGGGLDGYADGMCIGGDRFGNYEGLLPDGNYRECDIDTLHASSRGAKRLIYSDDGRIYYTDDHYESFTLLYGEE